VLAFDSNLELFYAANMSSQTHELIGYLDKKFEENNFSIHSYLDEQFHKNNIYIYGYLDKKFQEVHRRIDSLSIYSDRRFDAIDERFDEIDDHFDQVDARLWTLESDFQIITNNLK